MSADSPNFLKLELHMRTSKARSGEAIIIQFGENRSQFVVTLLKVYYKDTIRLTCFVIVQVGMVAKAIEGVICTLPNKVSVVGGKLDRNSPVDVREDLRRIYG